MSKNTNNEELQFSKFSKAVAELLGHPWTLIIFLLLTVTWIGIGFFLKFPELWQFLSHFITGILTLFIAISIQNSTIRDTKAIQIKLGELILTHDEARNSILDLSKLSDEQLKELEKKYEDLCNTNQKPQGEIE